MTQPPMPSASPRNWPAVLWLLRHGESAANVALREAEIAGVNGIDLPERDIDVPLSPLGERQSHALGSWFRSQPADYQPTIILSSPSLRASQTADRVAQVAWDPSRRIVRVVDERLREKEFGRLTGLTKAGILAKFPEEAAAREHLGKFYYRPPGGESWCDVILRLRSVLNTLHLEFAGERVLVVAHQIVVLCFRYLLERLSEQRVLEIDRDNVANCALTTYAFQRDQQGRGGLELLHYNVVTPLEVAGAPVTNAPDVPATPVDTGASSAEPEKAPTT